MAARFLIVDAHSVIFSWPELAALHRRRMLLAREALVKALTEFQDTSGVRVVVVFDGQGNGASDASEPGGIQVFYSGQGQTADDVIERLAATYGREFELTVATNDLAEQDTAAGFGAVCVSTERLKEMLEGARADFQRELKRHRRRR
ncbi:MAG: NYN domain-containing protein [Chthoniobacteraceae bacterium]|nr:NYN domain-containing protein [Chthoniobacteraceae bacterium]